MFGYIVIDKQELKGKHVQEYSAYYCGLCNAIRDKFGQVNRIFLSYDITYLLIVMDSLITEDSKRIRKKVGCMKKVDLTCSASLAKYASFINMYLLVKKMEDNYIDDKSIVSRLVAKRIEKNINYKIARKTYIELISRVDNNLSKIIEFEKSPYKVSVDEMCVPFAEIMGDILSYPFRKRKINKQVYDFGYYLGRIVYLIDAFDDYEKDKEKGAFNPLSYFKVKDEKEIFEYSLAAINLTYMKLKESMSKLDLKKNKEIVENVVNYGIPKKVTTIVNSKQTNECGRCKK